MLSRLTRIAPYVNVSLNKLFSTYYKIIPKERLLENNNIITETDVNKINKINKVNKKNPNYFYKLGLNESTEHTLNIDTIDDDRKKNFVFTTVEHLFKDFDIKGNLIVEVNPMSKIYYREDIHLSMFKLYSYSMSQHVYLSNPRPLFDLTTLKELNLQQYVNKSYLRSAIENNNIQGIDIAKKYIKDIYINFDTIEIDAFHAIMKHKYVIKNYLTVYEFKSIIESNRHDLLEYMYLFNKITDEYQNVIAYYTNHKNLITLDTDIFLTSLLKKLML
jgi:hypothetical protein